jgi:integrase
MTLIHLFGFLTGARIQTILTFRVRHVLPQVSGQQTEVLRLPIGPGTGIDTKNNKRMVLHIPLWFYELLRIYARSERAQKRRVRAAGGDHEDQYLFLSVRGAPLYQSKADNREFDATNQLRHLKSGQAVRQFITERVIPFVRKKYNTPIFHYQFHDTRATAGMNLTDHQLQLVEQGKATLHEVREYVRVWMGHDSSVTTDRYLQHKQNLRIARWAEHRYEGHLKSLAQQAMEGLT